MPDRLAVRTVPVADPSGMVSRLPDPAALAWIRHGEGLVGWGEAARITLPAGEDRFTAGEKWLRELFDRATIEDQVAMPGSGPVAFGSFTFDSTCDGSVLVVPSAVFGRRSGQAWLTTIGATQPTRSARPARSPRRPRCAGMTAACPRRTGSGPSPRPSAGSGPGKLGKVVLARDLYATASEDIDDPGAAAPAGLSYPDCYTFACAGLVGATPESAHQAAGRRHQLAGAGRAPPLAAGTPARTGRSGPCCSPRRRKPKSTNTPSPACATLAPLCDELRVDGLAIPDAPGQRAAPGHRHQRPLCPARQDTDHSVLALVAALHPTGAVCGTPTEVAMELIRELEGMDRGRYAGAVGWVDARGNGEWGIALRCAEVDGPRARLFAGGGIVSGSDPTADLAETQAKFRPMQFALEA